MPGPGAAANVTTPGCCDSSLLLQGVLSQTPICLICFDSLLDTSEVSLKTVEVVVWKKCGHLFHSKCLASIYGKFPSEVPHRRERRLQRQIVPPSNFDVDIDPGNNDYDYGDEQDEGEDLDLAISSGCPQCPKCKQRDYACSNAKRNSKGHCNPVQRVFFDTEPSGQGKPFPLVLAIPGQMTHRLDLVVIAKQLGVTLQGLQKQAKSLSPNHNRDLSEPWVKVATNIEEVGEEMTKMAHDILQAETSNSLKLAANNLLYEIPILTDCIEIRRYHAKRIHELKDEKSKLETKLEELEQKRDTSEAKLKILKARIDAVEDFDGLEALLEQYKKDNVSLGQEVLRWRWKAAEAERRTANASKAELSVLRRAWKEMCDDRGQEGLPQGSLGSSKAFARDMVGEIPKTSSDDGATDRHERDVAEAKVKILTFLEPSSPRVGEPPAETDDNDSITAVTGSPTPESFETQNDCDDTAAVEMMFQAGNLTRKRTESDAGSAGPSKRLRAEISELATK